MTSSEGINIAAQKIASFGQAPSGRYILYAENNEIVFGPFRKGVPRSNVIATITSVDVNTGLTPAKWDDVQYEIQKLIDNGVLI